MGTSTTATTTTVLTIPNTINQYMPEDVKVIKSQPPQKFRQQKELYSRNDNNHNKKEIHYYQMLIN